MILIGNGSNNNNNNNKVVEKLENEQSILVKQCVVYSLSLVFIHLLGISICQRKSVRGPARVCLACSGRRTLLGEYEI